VAKGPSAAYAQDYIESGDSVATINNSCEILNRSCDYLFFSDLNQLTLACSKKAALCVSPIKTHNTLPPEVPHAVYRDIECEADNVAFIKRITEGGICHHHTVSGALHWLCKFGKYTHIKIIGVDGGREFALGVTPFYHCHAFVANTTSLDFLDDWKAIDKRLCNILSNVYGTEFHWFEP
jgi:hypothetical protein